VHAIDPSVAPCEPTSVGSGKDTGFLPRQARWSHLASPTSPPMAGAPTRGISTPSHTKSATRHTQTIERTHLNRRTRITRLVASHHGLFQHDDEARSGDWPRHPSRCVWAPHLTWHQHSKTPSAPDGKVYILAEHMPEGALAKEDHPGQRFVFGPSGPSARHRHSNFGDRGGNGTRVTPQSINDLLNAGQNLVSRSCNEILARDRNPHSCMVTLRATCTIHRLMRDAGSTPSHIHFPAAEVEEKTARHTSRAHPASRPRR